MDKKIISKIGTVVSDKGEKTITVVIERVKEHPLYKKKYKITRKYLVHDEENQFKVGDKVEIMSCKPISKEKSFKVVRKVG